MTGEFFNKNVTYNREICEILRYCQQKPETKSTYKDLNVTRFWISTVPDMRSWTHENQPNTF